MNIVTHGFTRFFNKCQRNGWNDENYAMAVSPNVLPEFLAHLGKAFRGEDLPDRDETGNTYHWLYGIDITITLGSPESHAVLIPVHEGTIAYCVNVLAPALAARAKKQD
jgi:hypothetical protein